MLHCSIGSLSPPRHRCCGKLTADFYPEPVDIGKALGVAKGGRQDNSPPKQRSTVMKKNTRIVHSGRHPELWDGSVNPPVYRVSTVIAETVEEMHARSKGTYPGMSYGRHGTQTSFALEEAVADIEGGTRTFAVGSGLAAITATLTALLSPGDHVLISDSTYFPTRRFATHELARQGIDVTYYDPCIGAGIGDLIRPETRVVHAESPGSQTFEVQDIPAIAEAAHSRGALVVMDNTWGILSFQPFTKGVDVSIQAATKYIVGHSDAMLGTITVADDAIAESIKKIITNYGYSAGSEEVWLGLRGLRTMGVRLRQQFSAGLKIAEWLAARPEVARVMHPALPNDPGHDLWKRDFNGGGCGLFGVALNPASAEAVTAMLDSYKLFGLGYSWGGYESLVIPTTIRRTATQWRAEGPTVRYHVGLEDPEDLIADLERGFAALAKTS
jgi:cystathionine beta-lyase